MRFLLLLVALAVLPAHAQYPNKPVRLVVPFAPGGSTDIFARLIAERLQAPLGQPVVVENRAGAAGNIGAHEVVRAPADGHTLLMATTGVMAINNALYKNMTYDAAKDLEPVVYVASITNVLIVPPDFPAKNVAELVAMAKKEPGKLSFASSGAGASTHMSAELFKSMTGTDILHVPYKGVTPAMTDTVAGQVQMIISVIPAILPTVKAGRLKALGVTSAKRSALVPDIPTIGESVPGYEFIGWYSLAAPARTPAGILNKLNAEVVGALKTPEFRERFSALGAEPLSSTQQELAAFIQEQTKKMAAAVKASGARPE